MFFYSFSSFTGSFPPFENEKNPLRSMQTKKDKTWIIKNWKMITFSVNGIFLLLTFQFSGWKICRLIHEIEKYSNNCIVCIIMKQQPKKCCMFLWDVHIIFHWVPFRYMAVDHSVWLWCVYSPYQEKFIFCLKCLIIVYDLLCTFRYRRRKKSNRWRLKNRWCTIRAFVFLRSCI